MASEVWLSVTRGIAVVRRRRRRLPGLGVHGRPAQGDRLGPPAGAPAAPRRHPGVDLVDPAAISSVLSTTETALGVGAGDPPAADPRPAEVVALRVIVGMTVGETAAVVNKTEGAVRVLSHRGLRLLAAPARRCSQLAEGVTA